MTAQPLAPGSLSRRSQRLLWFGVFIAIVLIGATFAVAYHNVAETRKTMEGEILQRQKTIAASRAETTDAWLESLVEQSRRLVGSDLFQLFASEVDKLPGGVPLLFSPNGDDKNDADDQGKNNSQAAQLSSQLPLMRTMLSEFVAYTGFSAARIACRESSILLGSQTSS